MKKLLLFVAPVLGLVLCLSCNKKMTPAQAAAKGPAVNEADFMPFTKALKHHLDNDRTELKKVQFYVDQTLILRRVNGTERGIVKGGTLSDDHGQTVTEMTIPAYTPGICEGSSGDSLMISFDVAGNTLTFGAQYANEHFILLGTNWYNGVVDVNYDGKLYKIECGSCGNAGDAKLVIKKAQAFMTAPRASGGTKVITGRKVQ